MNQLAGVGQAAAFDDLVAEIELYLAVLDQAQQEGADVATEELAGVHRHGGGQVTAAVDSHAVEHDRLAGLGHFDITTRVGGEVHDHRTGTHADDHVPGHERRCPAPGNGRRRDDDV